MTVNTRLKFAWLQAAKRATHHTKAPQKTVVRSDSNVFAEWLVKNAESSGMRAQPVLNANVALPSCPLAMTCTPANGIVFSGTPLHDAFIKAVGTFTAGMAELSLGLCQHIMKQGTVWLDSKAIEHEAGKLLQELA